METFKYYRRGKGELDTSNFGAILAQGYVEVDRLDSKTVVTLLNFSIYLTMRGQSYEQTGVVFPLTIKGYVDHMRADKDLHDPAELYLGMSLWYDVCCEQVQHDSRNGIVSAKIDKEDVLKDLSVIQHTWFTQFVGADSSVPKFFPSVDKYATKVRENGKVVSLDYHMSKDNEVHRLVIVDDIVGGGATVQMLVDKIKESGYKGEIFLWVQYNEGIHKESFLEQFEGYYIGQDISKD